VAANVILFLLKQNLKNEAMWLFLNVLYVTYCVLCSKVLNSA